MSFKDSSNILVKMQNNRIVSNINIKFSKILNANTEGYTIFDRFGSNMYNTKEIYSSKEIVVLGCIMRK